MTEKEFMALCCEYLIDPSVALENEKVCKALQKSNDQQVKELLETEF